MVDAPQQTPVAPRRTLQARIARGILRCCLYFLLLIGLYLVIALVGLVPVNNDFEPTADGVEIAVVSTEVHADLILPIRNDIVDWRQHFARNDFAGDVKWATHIAIGWGNKEFYIETRTWDDVNAGTVARALFWPSATCMHVYMAYGVPSDARRTRISNEQYRRLVDYCLSSFQRDDTGRLLFVKGAYGDYDAFYDADGSYHAFNTCNCWVGGALKETGVRTGWFTPLPNTVGFYLPTAEAK